MAQFCRSRLLEDKDEQECREQLAFPKRVARAISYQVERISKAEESKSLFANSSTSNIWLQFQEDESDWLAVSETPRWKKPLFSPETAAALRQKLTK